MPTNNTTLAPRTYTIINGLSAGTFEVEVKEASGVTSYLRDLDGNIRMFTTRSGARKAISRALGRTSR